VARRGKHSHSAGYTSKPRMQT